MAGNPPPRNSKRDFDATATDLDEDLSALSAADKGGLMKRKSIAVLAILFVYLAIIVLPPLPDRLVLFPSTRPLDAGGAARRAIPFRDGELEAWCARSEGARRRGKADMFTLRFYGNADRAERWAEPDAEMCGERAVEVWGVNYPGFGGSSGPSRLSTIGPSALRAFDAMKEVAGKRPIIVFGSSFGTVAALHIAAERPVAGLVLHNPPAIREMILREFGWWNLWLLAGPCAARVPAALDSISNARVTRARAVFLLAENDEVVAPKYQALVMNAYAGEKRVISLTGAGHNSPMEANAVSALHASFDWLLRLNPE